MSDNQEPEDITMGPGRSASHATAKAQRVLACVLCQQRKIKCDRKFPCAHCIRTGDRCVPATLAPRRRRKKLPEKELVDRLRRYEGLMKKHGIQFEALENHDDDNSADKPEERDDHSGDEHDTDAMSTSSPRTNRSGHDFDHRSFWMSITNRHPRGPDGAPTDGLKDPGDEAVYKAWDHAYENDDNLLLGSFSSSVNLSTFHPETGHIFRLWQFYLENVNPLLKVTHTPTLQPRIIEAANNLEQIKPELEALMFSIYCAAVISLDDAECTAFFGLPKDQLLVKYRFGFQQALTNCRFLRTTNLDCLVAFFLYLMSVTGNTNPTSLCSILGVAIRLAQRMQINDERFNSQYPPLEGEIRRRLWWGLVLFDSRVSELSRYKNSALEPTWTCKLPANVNDSDFRPDMKGGPRSSPYPSEAIFVLARSEIGEFTRHTALHLNTTNPALEPLARRDEAIVKQGGSVVSTLEERIEETYLKHCDPDDPVHFMTLNTIRGFISKMHVGEHYFRSSEPKNLTESEKDKVLTHAIRTIECDTEVMTSPLTKHFIWLAGYNFPLPAYIHICHDLSDRPTCDLAETAWNQMSKNYETRFKWNFKTSHPLFKLFSELVLQVWEARETAMKESGVEPETPEIVIHIKTKILELNWEAEVDQSAASTIMDFGNIPMSLPLSTPNQGLFPPARVTDTVAPVFPGFYGMNPHTRYMQHFGWGAMN